MKKLLFAVIGLGLITGCAGKPADTTSKAQAEANKAKAAADTAAQDAKKVADSAKQAAEKNVTQGAAEVTCTHGKDVRTLAINKPEGGGCEVNYKKGETSSIVASAKSNLEHCQAVADKIKNNLSTNGFKCE